MIDLYEKLQEFIKEKENIEYGYCKCGCGNKTKSSKFTNIKRGIRKGEPYNYLKGHNEKDNVSIKLKRIEFDEDNGCWIWKDAIDNHGYGVFSIHRKNIKAHKYIYEILLNIKIDKNKEVHHLCENKICVNPKHIIILDHKSHMRLHSEIIRLSLNEVKDIKKKYENGESKKKLSKNYNIHRNSVRKIIEDKS